MSNAKKQVDQLRLVVDKSAVRRRRATVSFDGSELLYVSATATKRAIVGQSYTSIVARENKTSSVRFVKYDSDTGMVTFVRGRTTKGCDVKVFVNEYLRNERPVPQPDSPNGIDPWVPAIAERLRVVHAQIDGLKDALRAFMDEVSR